MSAYTVYICLLIPAVGSVVAPALAYPPCPRLFVFCIIVFLYFFVLGLSGQDERDSAVFNTRASVATDRLKELVAETALRQVDMEANRREKVGVLFST